jgi:hypothetical protein
MRSRIGAGMALVAAFIFALAPPAFAEGPLSQAQFRDRFVRRIHKLAPDATVKVVSDRQIELSGPGGEDTTSYLDNAYAEYLKDPTQLDQVLNGYGGVALESLKGPTPVQIENLVILLRRSNLSSRPFAGDLVEVLAVNNPDSFEIPRTEALSKSLGAVDDKLWDRAEQNTKSLIGKVRGQALSEGVLDVSCARDFAGSLLIFDSLWAADQFPGNGPIVVAAWKSELLVGHAGDTKAMTAMRDVVAEHASDPDLLSQTLLVRRAGHWATYP